MLLLVLIVEFLLRFDDLFCIVNTRVVANRIDGTLPEIHLAQHSTDSILRDAASLIERLCLRIAFYSHLLNVAQVTNQVVEHLVERCSGQVHLLVVVGEGLTRERHIAECTNQIEIRERAQCCHLSDSSVEVALCIGRILLGHDRRIFQHRVTTVDHVVEALPSGVGVHSRDVLLQYIMEGEIIIDTLSGHHILRSGLTPNHHTLSDAIVLECRVATSHDIVHVGLFIPEVLENNLVLRFDIQEV